MYIIHPSVPFLPILRASICLLVLAIFVLVGCEQSKPSKSKPEAIPTESSEDFIDLAKIEVVDIPLDDAPSDSQISTAMNVYFIFDGSGSMREPPDGHCTGSQQFKSKLEGAKWAVTEFLKKVPSDVNIGLYVFDGNGHREVVPLGANNHEKFLGAVEEIRAKGWTPLTESIQVGVDKLVAQYKRQLGYGEYRLVVVTDGQETGKPIPQAVQYTTMYGIPIYTIGLCIGEDHSLRQYSVSYRAADNFEDLAEALEETLAELEVFEATEFPEDGFSNQ